MLEKEVIGIRILEQLATIYEKDNAALGDPNLKFLALLNTIDDIDDFKILYKGIFSQNDFDIFRQLYQDDSSVDLSFFSKDVNTIEDMHYFMRGLENLYKALSEKKYEKFQRKVYYGFLKDLKENHPFIYENFECIINTLDIYYTNEKNEKALDSEFELTPEKLKEEMFLYLDYLDPTRHLSELFYRMLKEHRIFIWKYSPNAQIPRELSKYFNREDYLVPCTAIIKGICYINMPCEGNLKDFICLVHEFFHTLYNFFSNDLTCFKEVYSFIGERNTNKYLKEKRGYGDEIDALYDERFILNREEFQGWREIFEDLIHLLKEEPIANSKAFIKYNRELEKKSIIGTLKYMLGDLISGYISTSSKERQDKIMQSLLRRREEHSYLLKDFSSFLLALSIPELDFLLKRNSAEIVHKRLEYKEKSDV